MTQRPSPGFDSKQEDASTRGIAAIMRKNIITARRDFSIETVAEALLRMGTGGIPIVDDLRRPIGIVTLAEVMQEWLARGDDEEQEPRTIRLRDLGREATEPGLHSTRNTRSTVGDIMAPMVLSLRPETCIAEAAAAMAELQVHCLVVVDAYRAVIGLITTAEVTRWVASLPPDRRLRYRDGSRFSRSTPSE